MPTEMEHPYINFLNVFRMQARKKKSIQIASRRRVSAPVAVNDGGNQSAAPASRPRSPAMRMRLIILNLIPRRRRGPGGSSRERFCFDCKCFGIHRRRCTRLSGRMGVDDMCLCFVCT
ncbi:hypothetical protein EVAR_53662_1 [Eumeta japonica]|uniref:Uncharacterized protein n=1 Tax=Eumeta variegata TaxID=151549 RepID=A0A4C2A115_EUMVA|nr:hypothetical protein EVAR_53662_1 [Eumeta japonica]